LAPNTKSSHLHLWHAAFSGIPTSRQDRAPGGNSYAIVGVGRRGSAFRVLGDACRDCGRPMRLAIGSQPGTTFSFSALKDGVSLEHARAEIAGVQRDWGSKQFPGHESRGSCATREGKVCGENWKRHCWSAWRGGICVLNRLRQRGAYAACASCGAAERNCRAHRAGSPALSRGAAIPAENCCSLR